MPSNPPTYGEIVRALGDVVSTVPAVNVVTLYEPAQVQAWPHVYIILDGFTRTQSGQVTVMKPRLKIGLLVPIPTSEDLEIAAVEIAFAIADAVDLNPQFSGVLTRGWADTPDGTATWVSVGGTKWRTIEIFCDVVSKFGFVGAL
jgi:hypothetical protein